MTEADESRDLNDCEPILVERFEPMRKEFESTTGMQLFPTCTKRSTKKQGELYQVGRKGIPGEKILTQIDGIKKIGMHNYPKSRAIDVCVDIDPGPGKHAVWNPEAYAPLGPLCKKYGLIWGGDFSFKDYPHIELPHGLV